MLIPYVPDVTPFLPETDTHEHRQLKSQYKKVKGELQHGLKGELSVSYENAGGTSTLLKNGTSCAGHLGGYRAARDKYMDSSRHDAWEVMGQPGAWVDKQIAVLLSDHIEEKYGQCLVFCDSLGSRWSEPSTLRHWSNQQMLISYAPGVTSFLQEPDTHEHRQCKSQYKKVKGELQHDFEHEAKAQGKEPPRTWGPWEFMHVLPKGQARFRADTLPELSGKSTQQLPFRAIVLCGPLVLGLALQDRQGFQY